MKTTKLGIVLLAAFATLTVSAASPDSKTDQDTVAALDTEYQRAVKNNDTDTMNRILADDFVVVWGNGETHNKADLLNDARTKRVQYEHNEDTDKTVRVWGDTAVITSKLWLKGVDKGKPFEWHVWFNDTYVRTPAGWRYVDGFASLPLEMLPSGPAGSTCTSKASLTNAATNTAISWRAKSLNISSAARLCWAPKNIGMIIAS